ncbi:MAG: antitoxin VapB family protein [Candidatus Lokiarchaeota archaeon]|nr:antitoxin VapB family protein [Candidatus Lokiarchaeota archaeon]
MGFKTLSLSDEAYHMLKLKKKKRESFTDLIIRLLAEPEQKEILDIAGTWKGTDEESDEILNIIYKNRQNTKFPRGIE